MLEARGLEVRAGRTRLLQGVDLQLRPGRLLVLLGPNGAGKSTLLKCLSGATRPSAGQVSLDGRPLADWPQAALARRRAVLSQVAAPADFAYSVAEMVALGRTPHLGLAGVLPQDRVVRQALEETGAWHLIEREVSVLSGGERQRVDLARVLAQVWEARPPAGPGYLLLDEPTSGLDLVQQGRILSLARRYARMGYGVLAIVHDLTAALEQADEALLLSAGRTVAAGPVEAVLNEETLAKAYGAPFVLTRLEGSERKAILPAAP